MMKQTIKIEGLDCSACVMIIDDVLEELNGVKSAKTNYAKEQVEVEFDEKKVSIEAMLKIIKKAGYNPSV